MNRDLAVARERRNIGGGKKKVKVGGDVGKYSY
jgi:hypothetical protein